MKDRAIQCAVEVRDDLRDGISLVSSNLTDLRHGGVSLMELILDDLGTLRFLIPFMAAENPTPEKEETIVYLHSGLSSIGKHKRGLLRPAERPGMGEGGLPKTNSVSLVLSGPLCTNLSAQSDLFLLSYKSLLTEALKRQFFHYLKLASPHLCSSKALEGAILPFIINERYYFFQVFRFKEVEVCCVASEDPKTVSIDFISSLLIVPSLNQLESSSKTGASNSRSGALEIEDCHIVKNVRDVKNVIKSKSGSHTTEKNTTSSFYLDITHILNKYVAENNVSPKILKCIRSNVIEKVRDILEEIERFNLLKDASQYISVQLFLYNYKISFCNLSAPDSSPIGLLEDNFSKLKCLEKIILMEYTGPEGAVSPEQSNSSLFSSKLTHKALHLKSLISSRSLSFGAGAKEPHAHMWPAEGGHCGDAEYDEKELQERYARLKKELNGCVSKLLLDRNFDVFLELMRYRSLAGCDLDLASCTYSRSQCTSMLSWIIRVCFGISDRKGALRVAEILHRNLLIGDSLYGCYVDASREMLSNVDKTVTAASPKGEAALGVEDERINSIIEQVDEQLFVCKVFENQYSKINNIMNQQFTPRILIYSSENETSRTRLSLVKQEVMNYVKKHYINYKLVHKHILSLVSPYVGQSEENIRQLFNTSLPTILFLEGIETISGNFISNSKYSDDYSQEDFNSDSSSTDLDSNLFYDISFRIACHRERNKDIFNTNWCRYHPTLAVTNYQPEDEDLLKDSKESRTLLTTLLLCLDNVEKKNQNVIVIAFSSKHISKLDQSIIRAGRLDIHLCVD